MTDRIGLRTALGLAFATVAAAAFLALWQQPAMARTCWDNEADMLLEDGGCRNFIADPGKGHYLHNKDIATGARRSLYNHYGFSTQWLWYAPTKTIKVYDSETTKWAGCDVLPGEYGTCGINQVHFGDVGDAFFDNPVNLTVFKWGGAWVSAVCGNFTQNKPTSDPIPTITGRKFHDLDGDGRRDSGEPWLGGVKFELWRITSDAGQQTNVRVRTTTTANNGTFSFAMKGLYPGVYEVREVADPAWTATTATKKRIDVNPGAGNHDYDGGTYGNRAVTDIAKVGFDLIDPPDELEARTPTTLIVQSTIENRGPSTLPIEISDRLEVVPPDDCVYDIEEKDIVRTVTRGQHTIEHRVTVTCELPSSHSFTFTNLVSIKSAGVDDTNPQNNGLTFDWEVPVYADADLAIQNLVLDCEDEGLVGEPFACSLTGSASNLGPYGPVRALVDLDISPAGDCSASPASVPTVDTWIDVGSPYAIDQTWDVVCSNRSDHHHQAGASVLAVDPHVRDVPGNNTATAANDNEVYEYGEISADAVRILCTEGWDGNPFTCSMEVDVSNEGPANGVQTIVAGQLDGSASCSTTPDRTQEEAVTLDSGEADTLAFEWLVDCPEATPHTFTAIGTIALAEPHVIDDPGNNRVETVWLRIDFKPFSYPNSVNLGRGGVTSVAILATPDFDPFDEIVVESLRFGPNEAEAVRCSTEPEDLNGDGLGDMSCKFRNADVGWYEGQTLVFLTGYLQNGDYFMAADTVRVIL